MNRLHLTLALTLGTACAASAQTIYDGIGSYVWGSSSAASGWAMNPPNFTAQMFTATTSGTVSTIDVALQQGSGSTSPSAGVVSLWNATGSQTIGTQLGSNIAFASAPAYNSGSIVTVTGPSVTLTAGTNYWLMVTPNTGSGFIWRFNDPAILGRGATGTAASPASYFSNQSMGAFRVNAVPEPATMAILGLGVLPLLRRRRNQAS